MLSIQIWISFTKKEVEESHDSKPYFCGHGNLLEFFIGFGASFNQPNWVLYELPTWLNKLHYLIHDALGDGGLRRQKPVSVALILEGMCTYRKLTSIRTTLSQVYSNMGMLRRVRSAWVSLACAKILALPMVWFENVTKATTGLLSPGFLSCPG